MPARASDIEELERMLNDGEGDDELNSHAIKIFERIKTEVNRARPYGTFAAQKIKELLDQKEDLERVIKEIGDRRHAHALDRYKKHTQSKKI